jgi:hypothetical protein
LEVRLKRLKSTAVGERLISTAPRLKWFQPRGSVDIQVEINCGWNQPLQLIPVLSDNGPQVWAMFKVSD